MSRCSIEGLAHDLADAGVQMPFQLLDDILDGPDAVIGFVVERGVVQRLAVAEVNPGQRSVNVRLQFAPPGWRLE
ncbi:hypothetical protein [Tessaracoccus antarcticus]|uniref:Uncharacterized protein n=1 Tax=Tessaracoccus antarcticus TaxID=2479848 RepID=A0A3M0GAK5_9ACTN|nr:hypothetical protein [Tessaracoccus antarcticus]RMB61458.1 hypothetical protein EAX62_02070 [Tessaracoccus antarcticus]